MIPDLSLSALMRVVQGYVLGYRTGNCAEISFDGKGISFHHFFSFV